MEGKDAFAASNRGWAGGSLHLARSERAGRSGGCAVVAIRWHRRAVVRLSGQRFVHLPAHLQPPHRGLQSDDLRADPHAG